MKAAAVAAFFLVAVSLTGHWDMQEAERQAAEYCRMVEMWDATDGDAGWPPYKGRERCES